MKFKKMIKDHAFEWDYDGRCWEGSIEAVEDILEDTKQLAIMCVFIASSEPQGLSFLTPSLPRDPRRSRPWPSGHSGGRRGRPRGRQVAFYGSPGPSRCE